MLDNEKSIRAFMAIRLPAGINPELKRLQRRLLDSGVTADWVRPENIHLTLRFLGDIPIRSVAPVLSCIKSSADGIKAINLAVQGLGVFPNITRARVIWVGMGGETDRLADLHDHLEGELDKIGFVHEERRFTPHLTLGRIKRPVSPEILAGALGEFGMFSPVPFTAREIYLIKSELTKNGPIYTELGFVTIGA